MANYKIEIPDEKLDFVLELFNHFTFITYQASESEPIAAQMKAKFIEAETNPKPTNQKAANKVDELKALRNTINRLQNGRSDTLTGTSTTLFRFPHGTEVSAINISTYNHLISTIENYYRTNVTSLEFIANINNKGYEMDQFMVMITLRDKTELKAGYCNKNLG